MAEEKAAKPAAEKKEGVVKAERVKRVKQGWTIQRCMKAARRFTTEAEWKVGAPSSWKSATAHGWVKDCVAQMKGKVATRKIKARPEGGATPSKKSA